MIRQISSKKKRYVPKRFRRGHLKLNKNGLSIFPTRNSPYSIMLIWGLIASIALGFAATFFLVAAILGTAFLSNLSSVEFLPLMSASVSGVLWFGVVQGIFMMYKHHFLTPTKEIADKAKVYIAILVLSVIGLIVMFIFVGRLQ